MTRLEILSKTVSMVVTSFVNWVIRILTADSLAWQDFILAVVTMVVGFFELPAPTPILSGFVASAGETSIRKRKKPEIAFTKKLDLFIL